jgi:hypothetical protein
MEGEEEQVGAAAGGGEHARPRKPDSETLSYLRSLEDQIEKQVALRESGGHPERRQPKAHDDDTDAEADDEEGEEEEEDEGALLVTNLIDELTHKVPPLFLLSMPECTPVNHAGMVAARGWWNSMTRPGDLNALNAHLPHAVRQRVDGPPRRTHNGEAGAAVLAGAAGAAAGGVRGLRACHGHQPLLVTRPAGIHREPVDMSYTHVYALDLTV